MVSERIKNIRDISFDYNEIFKYIAVQEVVFNPDSGKSPILRHADAFCAVLDQMNMNYIPGSLLAGNGGDKFISRPKHLLEGEYKELQHYPKNCSAELIDTLREEIFYLWPFSDGHLSPGFEKLLNIGIDGLLAKISLRMKDNSLTKKQKEFLLAAKQQWEAVKRLAIRYAAFFSKISEEADTEENKKEYKEISETISRVPSEPAKTFREALQSLYFLHMCTQFDDVSNHSFGRLDQYIYPYYKKDIQEGIITKAQAEDLFYEFWLKFTPGYIKSQNEGIRSEGQGFIKDNIPENGLTWLTLKCISHIKHLDDGQTMDLCGYKEDKSDGTNAVSWMAINALNEFRTFEPKIVVKYTDNIEKDFMKQCYGILASGHGLPAISYHKTGLKGFGQYNGYYKQEDCLNYCHIGCVELGIAGKAYTDPMNCFFNLPKVLLVTMNGGYLSGKLIGKKQKAPETFEAFKQNYYEQISYFLDLYTAETNSANPFYAQYFFRPLVSASIDGCIEKALPVDEGGSVYWSKSINCSGLATAADSVYTVKKLVYDNAEFTLDQFNDILLRDYQGNEMLRNKIANVLPKYGNGVKEVDDIAADLVRFYCGKVRTYKTYIGSPYRPGLYSFYETINRMGRITGATPNGRKAGERFSLNSAPDHGAIRNGLTDALRSVTSFEHALADNACTVDLHLSQGIPPAIIQSITEYLANHGTLYLQITIVNKDDILNAEENPDKYKDLIVRVTGFSAYYVSLDEHTRHEILERSFWN
jgi:formate C-acetyltransferase